MDKLRRLFGQFEFHIMLFCIGFGLLNWPIVGIFLNDEPGAIYFRLFKIWAILIFILFLMTRSFEDSPEPQSEDPKDET